MPKGSVNATRLFDNDGRIADIARCEAEITVLTACHLAMFVMPARDGSRRTWAQPLIALSLRLAIHHPLGTSAPAAGSAMQTLVDASGDLVAAAREDDEPGIVLPRQAYGAFEAALAPFRTETATTIDADVEG